MIIKNVWKSLLLVSLISLMSCDSQGNLNSSNSLTSVKQIITSSINQGYSVLGNPDQFLTNALIDAVLPDELKKINTKLESIGLESLVTKEKKYIAQAASSSVEVAKPIISSAIQEMTLSDAVGIIAGGKGAATKYLQQKTEAKLIAAIQPKVESQLNSNGIISMINSASKEKNILGTLGSILGNKKTTSTEVGSSISEYATKHIVKGLFSVAQDYEKKNTNTGEKIIESIFNSSSQSTNKK